MFSRKFTPTISRLGELARESRLGMEVLPDWEAETPRLAVFLYSWS